MQISHYLHHLQLCAKNRTPSTAKKLHCQISKLGLNNSGPLPNTIIDVYGKCGLIEDALNMFDEMPQRDPISWASILTAHNQSNHPTKTLTLFPTMFTRDGLLPDHFVFASLVKACATLTDIKHGKEIHSQFIVSRFYTDDVVKSSLVDMYAKCGLPDNGRAVFDSIGKKNPISCTAMISGYSRSGRLKEAVELFEKLPVKNLYSWTALISGLVQSGKGIDAFRIFIKMRRENVQIIDPLVLSSIVGACSNLAVLELGKQVHGFVIHLGYQSCLFITNAFVDMYAKCSDINAALCIFHRMENRDVVSWTSIIVGVAQHGRAEEALGLYDKMVSVGVNPNQVTFIGLIYACSHVGLVTRGRELFNSMTKDYGITPSLQHYTCYLDLLGRSGFLDEAEGIIGTMPYKPDEPTWAALLSASNQHGDTRMAVRVADRLFNSKPKPEDPSTYILLSNVYANAYLWDKVSEVRKKMVTLEVKKEAGFSFVDLGKESEYFYAGDTCHYMKDEILGLLKGFEVEMRKRGYVPDTSFVLHDMDEMEKERLLFMHSERLALGYALLNGVSGKSIRIVKNLRVCGDCHTVMRFISDIVKREIIVRDATRYHHFKDGECSCNNFW